MRISPRIFLFITFALVFTARANVFAQDQSGLDDTRFTTFGPQKISSYLGSVVSDSLHWGTDFVFAGITSDGNYLKPFMESHKGMEVVLTEDGNLSKEKLPNPLLLKLARITRHLDMTETSTGGVVRTGSMMLSVTGFAGMQPPRYFEGSVTIFRDTIASHLVSVPHEDKPKTFWESTAEPILVTLGAAAIIALFFIIRS